MRMKLPWASLLIPLVTACTWVKMAPGADAVEVAALGKDMSACQRIGYVDVSVRDRLGPYERDALKIRDELETLARNEAPGLSADTVQPEAEPNKDSQRFLAFRCKGLPKAERPAPRDEVDVTPIRD